MSNFKRINVLLTTKDIKKLKQLAQAEQTSVAYLIRKAVKKVYKNQLDDNPDNDNKRFNLSANLEI